MTDVFEVAKGPYDMFGSRVWYMNLRESNQPQANEGKIDLEFKNLSLMFDLYLIVYII